MNRITLLFIACFLFSNGINYAQDIMDGDPYYFCAMNGSCYNNIPGRLVTNVAIDFSPEYAAFITEQFLLTHDGCTIIEPASELYNCQGYAYSVYQGGPPLQIGWKEELCSCNGTSIESYIQIQENQVQKGDIATIIEYDIYPLQSRHSAIVWNSDTMISKLNNGPLFKHHKNEPWFAEMMGLNVSSHYVYYRRVINTNSMVSGPSIFNGTGTYTFTPNATPTNCTWSVEPAAMFQNASGTGTTAYLNYAMPFVYLTPKATLTFTFNYDCDNHYTATKEIDLRIPTTTISGNVISDGLVIDDNAIVTVTGNIKSNKNAKTIVPVGTRLIINGGKMTSNGDVMWSGIQVWGNKDMHQYAVNGNYVQGYLELKNGAIIENAVCAVELWRPGYYATTGGIIHATNATFRNCAKAIHALHYTNYNPATEEENSYSSYFRNCTFTIDQNYLGTTTFYKHVDMQHVKGLQFKGCEFIVNRSVEGVSQYCIGIAAYEAGFSVGNYCSSNDIAPCPNENIYRSSFLGFYNGISASNNGSTACTFRVEDAEFFNNTIGIYALNTGFATVRGCDFTIGCGSACDFGIYAEGVTGFCFEENTFKPKNTNVGSPYGIAVVNSQGGNEVYDNSFENLLCGNVAVGDNTSSLFSSSSLTGLTYTCNTNTGNRIDFSVLKDGNVGGISSMQGSLAVPAGNTFGGSQYHFYNDGTQLVQYFYDQNETSQAPSSTLLHRVNMSGTSNANTCPSHYGGGTVIKSSQEKAALVSDYLSAYAELSGLRQLYESRIDGGSTATQVADINGATPSDQWRLRAQLLGLSPYVSGETLATAASRSDVFDDPVLFEILSANPDELKKDSLINYLETKVDPLPTYMINLLRQMVTGFTARTALESQMAEKCRGCSIAAGDIVRSDLNDSIAHPEELRTWLGNMNEIAADRMAIASYLQEGDSTHAFSLANILPDLYGLHGDALADHSDYMLLLTLHQTLNREGRNSFQLTASEMDMVENIAENGRGASKAMAEAMLSEITENRVNSLCPDMPAANGREETKGAYTSSSVNEAMGFTVSASPNPASTWVTVDYSLPADAEKAVLDVANSMGLTVMSVELNSNQGEKVLDLRGLAPGVYIYRVSCNKHIHNGKIVITK